MLCFLGISDFALADDSFSYETVEMRVEGSGDVSLFNTKSVYSVDYFIANLSFFPKDSGLNQIVIDQSFDSNPDSEISFLENAISYKWNKPVIGELGFGFVSNIFRRFDFVKVDKKLNFPYRSYPDDVKVYLKPTNLINSDDEEIKRTASGIVEGVDDFYVAVHKLASWVNENINYTAGPSTLEYSKDSKWVLKNKVGVCDELTNLFVAMVRSVGIPARFVSGVAYSNQIGDFGTHAWAEVYFPGFGWVSFDVTYEEYGFVDATHVKFRDGIDGSFASVDYSWRGQNVDSEVKGVTFSTSVVDHGPKIKWDYDISLNILKDEVGGGSYVPVVIELKNRNDYYLPVTLRVSKAPSSFGASRFNALVPPLGEKKIFTILEIPSDLKEGFGYSSVFEIVDFFDSVSASDKVYYDLYSDVYSYGDSLSVIQNLVEEEQSEYSSNVGVDCSFDKQVYYVSDVMSVQCVVSNEGNVNLEELQVCVKDSCDVLELFISEQKNVSFGVVLTDVSNEVVVDIDSDEVVKHAYFEVNVYDPPNLEFVDFAVPEGVGYGEVMRLGFNVSVDSPVRNVVVVLGGRSLFAIEEMKAVNAFDIPVYGSFFYNRPKWIKIVYEDLEGGEHEALREFEITVTNVPFYVRYGVLIFFFVMVVIVLGIVFLVKQKKKRIFFEAAPLKKRGGRSGGKKKKSND
ncbi:MAG: transglutaminase-like domain-containing protein [Nanoarchaeota archaeon]|nr:transglutaminase-like domain-containing protein [Nanoarchaeota archaeon]